MKIQVNAQTCQGVWGYQITVLDANDKIMHWQWFATNELPSLPSSEEQSGCSSVDRDVAQ